MNRSKILNWLAAFAFIAGFLALGAGIIYCLTNNSGHSGYDPRLTSLCFLPIFAIGLIDISDKAHQSQFGWLALLIGIFGLAFGFFIDMTGIMREYNRWASEDGLQNPPKNASLLISVYALIVLLGIIVSMIMRKVRS